MRDGSRGNGNVETGRSFELARWPKFCPQRLARDAGAGIRRPRCQLRPRGCGCSADLRWLCASRIATRPALHRCWQHKRPEKQLLAAAANMVSSSTIVLIHAVFDSVAVFMEAQVYNSLEFPPPVRRMLPQSRTNHSHLDILSHRLCSSEHHLTPFARSQILPGAHAL